MYVRACVYICAFVYMCETFKFQVIVSLHSIILGLCSVPLIVLYPLMKRITNWPQVALGTVQVAFVCCRYYVATDKQCSASPMKV